MKRRDSTITVTDQFCGAGGSSIGAAKAGLRVRMALNHWQLAIETHNTNFPETDHDCCDVSASDPRRYPSTDILITSPECTTHSPAGGNRRSKPQRDLFVERPDDPSVERSRATMWDVPRFAEFHRYNAIIVENVVEVLRWELFATWLNAMQVLGYEHRVVSVNSQFCWPTPQSRDRVYVVFWRRGNRAPLLDLTPQAWCAACDRDVAALQTWKNGRTVGKFGRQYVYTCPTCRRELRPYYFAALNAIDLSLPGKLVGDRLRPRTRERIKYGLERYGRRALLVTTNQTNRLGGRVRTVADPSFAITSTPTAALVHPGFLVACANGGGIARRVRDVDQPVGTVHAGGNNWAFVTPFTIETAHSQRAEDRSRSVVDPLAAHGARQSVGLVVPPAAVIANRNNNVPRALDASISTITSGGGHMMLMTESALLTLRNSGNENVSGPEDPTTAMLATCSQHAVIGRAPFMVSAYRTKCAAPADAVMPAITTLDRHAVVEPSEELRVEDCYFRMLQPHEIGAAMAFPETYTVLGNKRDRVRQYGNAVTPPAMEFLIRRVVESLAPEVAA